MIWSGQSRECDIGVAIGTDSRVKWLCCFDSRGTFMKTTGTQEWLWDWLEATVCG